MPSEKVRETTYTERGYAHGHGFAKVAAAAALVMLAIWLGFKARNEAKEYDYIGKPLESYTISVSGEGKVVGIPDVATVDLGMTTEKTTVAAAQQETTRVMNALVAELKKQGVAEQDIQTTGYNVYPSYDWIDGRQRLRGYTVSQNVRVKIRNLETVGTILGKAGELGANQVGGVQFTVDDPAQLEREAREKALANAKEKAEALARVAGVRLGRVINFQESFTPFYPPYYDRAVGMGGAESDGAKAPTIEPGSNEVTASVTITYQLD